MRAQTPPVSHARQQLSAPAPSQRAGSPTRIPSRPPGQARSRRNRQSRPGSHWPTVIALSLLCTVVAVLVFVQFAHSDLAVVSADVQRDPRDLSLREVALLVLTVSIPLATGLFCLLVGAQTVRLLRIFRYLRRLHVYTRRRLRGTAPLYQRGILPRVHPVTDVPAAPMASTRLSPRDALPPQRLLSAGGPVVLTGEAGSGKMTALLSLAYELSRPSSVLAVFFGRRRLPVLVSLRSHALSIEDAARPGPHLADLQAQVARYGSPGLAARLPRLIRLGRVVLLCDSLSDVSLGMQSHVLLHLAQLAGSARRRRDVPLIVTRSGTLGGAFPAFVASDASVPWQHWSMAPLSTEEAVRIAASGITRPAARKSSRQARELRDELQALRLDRAVVNPAQLLSFVAVSRREAPLPYGRAALVEQALDAACAAAATEDLPAAQLRDTLATLASALANADVRSVPLPPGLRLGEALSDWLAAHRPYSPLVTIKSGPLAIIPEVAHACCLAGLKAGLLVVSSDDASIAFSNSLTEAACAAAWLGLADDGSSPLDSGLLRPRWALPVILWTATSRDPGRVTRRLLPLASARPESYNTLALATTGAQARPTSATASTLALAGLTAAVAPAVSSFQHDGADHAFQIAAYERRVREVLDGVLDVLTPDPDPTVLIRATQSVEGEVGDELAADIAYLADYTTLSRLARAQLVTVLGLLASPLALTALVEHLADRDPTLRSAVNRGFALIGPVAVPVLQQKLASADEWTRTRAREAMDSISAATIEAGVTAPERAVRALSAPDPRQRAAAALTLGALRATGASQALIGRLDDPDVQVRMAALEALGTLVDPAALDALRSHLDDPEPAVRSALAETLGAYRDASLLSDLAALLHDTDGTVRAAAATAMGLLGDGNAVGELLAHRGDPDPRTQAAVAGALRRLGDAPEGGVIRATMAPALVSGEALRADAS
ncbi:MAG TPA: HEAT repeat domain-containing protein [Ktedonobacterales bacterium]